MTRYKVTQEGRLVESDTGPLVHYEDFKKIEAEVEGLRETVDWAEADESAQIWANMSNAERQHVIEMGMRQ